MIAQPTVSFVTSIRHPDNSNNYDIVWKLLEHTLISICGQTNSDFEIIIVTNKILNSFESHKRIKNVRFIKVDFPAPDEIGKHHTSTEALRIDRGTKYIIGTLASNGKYVMFFDADDFIHKDLVGYIAQSKDCNGFIINNGYTIAGDLFKENDHFSGSCGTCQIVKQELLMNYIQLVKNPIPSMNIILNIQSTQEEIIYMCGEFFVKIVMGDHHVLRYIFQLEPLPFRAAAYYLFNGQNWGLDNNWLEQLHLCSHWTGGDTKNVEGKLISEYPEFVSDFNITLL